MGFELTVLGSSSATPTSTRNPSAQILKSNEQLFLIDCGEATQFQLRKLNFSFNKINNIFISHLHGDHFLGLLGLISSMHLFGRTKELNIFAHPKLEALIDLYRDCSNTVFNYTLKFHHLSCKNSKLIYEDEIVTVESIILKHKIDCCGFVFKAKQKPRRINKAAADKYDVPICEMENLKQGKDYITSENKIIKNPELTLDPLHSCSYAYCSDTVYCEEIVPHIKNVDLLYHEATFMSDMQSTANEKLHSTTIDAANIAKKANAKQLLIGHFSARYKDVKQLLEEAKSIFENTLIAEDGYKYLIN